MCGVQVATQQRAFSLDCIGKIYYGSAKHLFGRGPVNMIFMCKLLCLSVRLSVCLSTCHYQYMSARLSIYLSVCLSITINTCLSVSQSVSQSVCQSRLWSLNPAYPTQSALTHSYQWIYTFSRIVDPALHWELLGWPSIIFHQQYSLMLPAGLFLNKKYLHVSQFEMFL